MLDYILQLRDIYFAQPIKGAIMETVSFTRMEDGSREDYILLAQLEKEHTTGTADRVLEQLLRLKDSFSGYKIDRLQHSLQVATRAYRDGAGEDQIVSSRMYRPPLIRSVT